MGGRLASEGEIREAEKPVQVPLTEEQRETAAWQQRTRELYDLAEERYGFSGSIAIVCGEQGRWSHFTYAMTNLVRPLGSTILFDPGLDIPRQCNNFVRAARMRGDEWLWIIGDDHVFNGDIVLQLLKHDLDVVVPNVLQRSAPFHPVVYKGQTEEAGHHEMHYSLPEHGVHEVYAAGSAGMLISKRVIDALPEEPFQRRSDILNEDLEFCRLAREAGFKIWIDVDVHMAHIGTMVVWPRWSGEDGWGANIEVGPRLGDQPQMIPVKHVTPGSAALRSA